MSHIDVHIHLVTPEFIAAVQAAGDDPAGTIVTEWSAEEAIAYMDARDIGKGILSFTSPGPLVAGPAFVREMNEKVKEIVAKEPTRFGWFASLPDWNADDDGEAVAVEAEWALKAGAAGFIIMTTYGQKLIGHEKFQPIWDKLDELNAVCLVHPSELTIQPKHVASFMPQPLIDYPLTTTRAAADLVITRTLAKHPNVKVILSHAGGALPFLAERIITLSPLFNLSMEDCRRDMQRFYVDTALASSKAQLMGLTAFLPSDHILYGTDWPYVSPMAAKRNATELNSYIHGGCCCGGFGQPLQPQADEHSHGDNVENGRSGLSAVWRENAEKLFGWGKYATSKPESKEGTQEAS